MTRKILSRDSGVSERYIAQLELGRGNISILLLRQLARALDTPVEALVFDGPEPSPDFARTVELLRGLTPGDLGQAHVGGSVTYVGDRVGEFVPSADLAPQRQVYPSYAQLDLHAGIKYETWKASMFVQNVTDKRGVTGGGFNNQTNYNQNWFTYNQPRTIGVSLEKTF